MLRLKIKYKTTSIIQPHEADIEGSISAIFRKETEEDLQKMTGYWDGTPLKAILPMSCNESSKSKSIVKVYGDLGPGLQALRTERQLRRCEAMPGDKDLKRNVWSRSLEIEIGN